MLRRDVVERAVALIAIQTIETALAAVGDVEVLPAVAIEIGDGDRRAHRRHLRHDVRQPRVEHRRDVREIDAASPRNLLKRKAVARQRVGLIAVRGIGSDVTSDVSHTPATPPALARSSAFTATRDATSSAVHTTHNTRCRRDDCCLMT